MSIIVASTTRGVHPLAAVASLPRAIGRTLLALLLSACLAAPVVSAAVASHTRAVSSVGVRVASVWPYGPCPGGFPTPC